MNGCENIEVELFIKPENLEQHLKKLHQGAVFTKGEYISDIPGYINDMEWNFYDELHRYYVHNTYHDQLKVFSGKTFSVNIVKWGRLPIFIQVANAKIAPNLFYQTMSLLGIFYIHQIMKLEQLDRAVKLSRSWYTVSHWLFRPLHAYLNRSMMKLQIKQDIEDNEQIRHRRLALRDAGYHFTTDQANFTNSNQLTNNVIFPKSEDESRLSISNINTQDIQRVTVGILELLVKRENNHLRVWPGICPHEGALLNEKHVCDGIVQCPWHGRRFSGTLLKEGGDPWCFSHFEVSLETGHLLVRCTFQKNAHHPAPMVSSLSIENVK
ncbi:MAG: Rieske 2Fe-2S domain-containing protein [Methylococcales bacterium]|nr:Rieske 2Fe-2S domain-containing protein [Methylococcales bacterium]